MLNKIRWISQRENFESNHPCRKNAQNAITPIENYDNVVSYCHTPLVPLNEGARQRAPHAFTSPAAGFDESRPGGAP